jgi:hypothetical protein
VNLIKFPTWDDEENNTLSRIESSGKEDKKPLKCGDFKFVVQIELSTLP